MKTKIAVLERTLKARWSRFILLNSLIILSVLATPAFAQGNGGLKVRSIVLNAASIYAKAKKMSERDVIALSPKGPSRRLSAVAAQNVQAAGEKYVAVEEHSPQGELSEALYRDDGWRIAIEELLAKDFPDSASRDLISIAGCHGDAIVVVGSYSVKEWQYEDEFFLMDLASDPIRVLKLEAPSGTIAKEYTFDYNRDYYAFLADVDRIEIADSSVYMIDFRGTIDAFEIHGSIAAYSGRTLIKDDMIEGLERGKAVCRAGEAVSIHDFSTGRNEVLGAAVDFPFRQTDGNAYIFRGDAGSDRVVDAATLKILPAPSEPYYYLAFTEDGYLYWDAGGNSVTACRFDDRGAALIEKTVFSGDAIQNSVSCAYRRGRLFVSCPCLGFEVDCRTGAVVRAYRCDPPTRNADYYPTISPFGAGEAVFVRTAEYGK